MEFVDCNDICQRDSQGMRTCLFGGHSFSWWSGWGCFGLSCRNFLMGLHSFQLICFSGKTFLEQYMKIYHMLSAKPLIERQFSRSDALKCEGMLSWFHPSSL